jgi:hypothetical protein
VKFSDASRTVQVRSFLFSATIAILTLQVIAVYYDGLYGLLYSVPSTVVILLLSHRLLGRPLARRPRSDQTLIVDSPIFAPLVGLFALGALPGVWATAGWPAAAAWAALLAVGAIVVLRTQGGER